MKFRKLRIAWSVAWGVVAVLLCVLWVRSYYAFDRASGRVVGWVSPIVVSYAGLVTVVNGKVPAPALWRFPKVDSGPINGQPQFMADEVWPGRTIGGFGWIHETMYKNIPVREVGWYPGGMTGRSQSAFVSGLAMPHWFVVLLAAVLGLLPWHPRRFSLRTLLIVTTVVAVGLGIFVWMWRAG